MLEKIIQFSISNKLVIILFTSLIIGFGIFSLTKIPIGAVPDITNNQVQVITTSRNLATQDVEKFLTYPVELEMANLPNVKEIRSISKFGLSVVTIIFDDEIGTYLPRQLIAEKIQSAQEKIPQGFGSPFMGPITTGLGEIYQYIIDVDSAYASNYTITDLRTIQDWIVKRQLSGIPGVVEVNTWGGFLKQYQIARNPEQLRALNVSISDVFTAIESNNSIAGGGYIEKENETYFIRGEGMVQSINDIENIVVTNRNNTPILIKNIATVKYDAANRFGAVTGNGEGEKVLDQVMMLKGANSKKVIEEVKHRVSEISKSLPKGIKINAFLERSELIGKTTFTVAENLIMGCLIVIFVVVLLLGNIRSGLVVASVIPLCLFFALSCMYIFGVDANLMSLGAIDFGIIIDGAVIIVEFIAFKISTEQAAIHALPKEKKQQLINKITFLGTTKMMRSAIFGQIIIVIVFIPILSLVGVEGKMFKPMALVFCFALIGAMILCFTYVPVMASLFLKPIDSNKKNISTQLIAFLNKTYRQIIKWALRKKTTVILGATTLLILAISLFSTMGGEFVPTLDEGDIVIQPILKTGTSLTKTIETTTEIEKIVLKFPEVDQVVSRIGAAEVPTDPMSMEESDVMIKLKPKNTWTTVSSKDELVDTIKAALMHAIAGVDYEFTQPIEMRFNELITGVRADLAIKLYGENLDVLYKKALEIKKEIEEVPGAADISVDKVAGLPQMSVKYNRERIAQYGLSIATLNDVLTMNFAGKTAGTVFEGEKQFDLVVKLDESFRKDIENIENTSILLPNGTNLPFKEFATISYTQGPAKISRNNTKRNIVIGINVRNRDIESVVLDVQNIINRKVKIPVGYSIEYGGQFENLRSAKSRLLVAVPIALLLIYFLLYFAFHSVQEALMIYTAIPLSAVGGIGFLYLRDLPFSISAGVGFIALFGIAVLNGIVLIEQFKELKEHGITNINKRILMGTQQRLRPVLLTAAAAALGFLPMAISENAGAEVQRPLATVVIGGLITATLLTLIVLPVLYALLNERKTPIMLLKPNKTILLLFLLVPCIGVSQHTPIDLNQAIEIGLANNHNLKASQEKINQSMQLEKTAFTIDKTEIYYGFDQNNIAPNNIPLNVWGINQSFRLPMAYIREKNTLQAQTKVIVREAKIQEQILKKEISKSYYTILYWEEIITNYIALDSIYQAFAFAAKRKFETGESNTLEYLTAQAKQKEIEVALKQSIIQKEKEILQLNQWMQTDVKYTAIKNQLNSYAMLVGKDSLVSPTSLYLKESILFAKQKEKLANTNLYPSLTLGLFQGTNKGNEPNAYYGVQAGIALPLFFTADKANIKAAKTNIQIQENQLVNYEKELNATYQSFIKETERLQEEINYYLSFGKNLEEQTIYAANKAFKAGEINYIEYSLHLENAFKIKQTYINHLHQYNLTLIETNYLIQ